MQEGHRIMDATSHAQRLRRWIAAAWNQPAGSVAGIARGTDSACRVPVGAATVGRSPGAGLSRRDGCRTGRRAVLAALLTLGLVSLPAHAAARVAGETLPDLSGQYLAAFAASCDPSTVDPATCQKLVGPVGSFMQALTVSCVASGRCIYHTTYVATERAPGAPARCDAS